MKNNKIKRNFSLSSNKSVEEKIAEMKQQEEEETKTNKPTQTKKEETFDTQNKGMIDKLEIDQATQEALKYKYNLIEETTSSTFNWKKTYKKQLQHLSIETGISMENYLKKWAVEGLEKELKKIGENLKK